MYMIKTAIIATGVAQRIIPFPPVGDNANTAFQTIIPQNNGANVIYLGDASITITNALQFPPGSSLGSASAAIPPGDLKDFYVIGTAADILNTMVFP